MEKSLVERYVHDVIRRLPEKEQEEVRKELNANIFDMLPDNPDEEAVKAVLYELGSPASLAEKYRQNPRYLISPALYEEYVRVLKWTVPVIGLILFGVGIVVGAAEIFSKNGLAVGPTVIGELFSDGISTGVSGVFQTLLWVTVGFAIADRIGYKSGRADKDWKIEDLPGEWPEDKYQIPLPDSIVELVVTLVFSGLVILFCLDALPFSFAFYADGEQIKEIFATGFLTACIPAAAVLGTMGVIECAAKIIKRRWTPLVCGIVILNNLISIGVFAFLLTQTRIFSREFSAFLQGQEWSDGDLLRFLGEGVDQPLIVGVLLVVILSAVVECGLAIYRTIRAAGETSKTFA